LNRRRRKGYTNRKEKLKTTTTGTIRTFYNAERHNPQKLSMKKILIIYYLQATKTQKGIKLYKIAIAGTTNPGSIQNPEIYIQTSILTDENREAMRPLLSYEIEDIKEEDEGKSALEIVAEKNMFIPTTTL